jgi:FHS family L-fucose permease-like MFS transporter
VSSNSPENHAAFVGVTTLFFAWGFITAMIDPLIPAVRAIFTLTRAQSTLTQSAFFLSYAIVSLPAAALVARRGYAASILYALVGMFAGCMLMLVATHFARYTLVLAALFVIGSGITVLQVAANPLAAALGPPARSHFRLTLSQAFNSLGTVVAPYLGATLMLRGGVFAADTTHSAAMRDASLRKVDLSFLLIAGLIALLAVFVALSRRRLSSAAPQDRCANASVLPALRSGWALLGGAAIFLYVGAEVCIGSIMIFYLNQPSVLNVSLERAGQLLSLYWLGAMVGRFAGSALLTRMPAARLTLGATLTATLLCLIVMFSGGWWGAGAAIAIGLCNSILFPTIFTLTLERSSAAPAATSGLLCMAIVGGAVLPRLAGAVLDHSIDAAFAVPAVAYALIAIFALAAKNARPVAFAAAKPQPSHLR